MLHLLRAGTCRRWPSAARGSWRRARRAGPSSSTLMTMPSISCSTLVAVLAVVLDELDDLVDAVDDAVVRRGRQPPRLQQLVDLGLAVDRAGSAQAPMPCTSMRSRRSRSSHQRELRRRSCPRPSGAATRWRRCAGSRRRARPPRAGAAFSSSNSATGKKISPRTSTSGGWPVPASRVGDRAHDVADVLGDVFADDAVAAGGRRDEHAVLVAQVDGEAVDLQLAEVVDARGPASRSTLAAHSSNSSIENTLSRLSMRSACSTGANSVVSARPPTVCVGLSWLCSSGMQPLELVEPPHQRVVLRVADAVDGVALVVRVAQLEDARRQLLRLGAWPRRGRRASSSRRTRPSIRTATCRRRASAAARRGRVASGRRGRR